MVAALVGESDVPPPSQCTLADPADTRNPWEQTRARIEEIYAAFTGSTDPEHDA